MKLFSFLKATQIDDDILLHAKLTTQSRLKEKFIREIYENSNEYEFVKFIDNQETNTQCFFMKSKSKLYLTFRGTSNTDGLREFFHDLTISINVDFVDFDLCGNFGQVHKGFLRAYKSVREEIFEIINEHKLPVQLVGHSLGGALAVLCAIDLYENLTRDFCCCNFGTPKIGDKKFKKSFIDRQIKIKRFFNIKDPIPCYPFSRKFKHVGERYKVGKKYWKCKSINFHFMKTYIEELKKLK